ncbi:tigger transposable element-derived protein 6 [Trichonephila inaurata madagascariensis]|uniref:Tigger transposable element-derived protein 6 n=1 Tax=Trichonephila inaurata madagascariensis TaxID=2747483 RepID=A0A8X7C8P0_9ARAC|nr:tigger transposable element-derived protein 6 [Trichonephila inaurata madagascariensis]
MEKALLTWFHKFVLLIVEFIKMLFQRWPKKIVMIVFFFATILLGMKLLKMKLSSVIFLINHQSYSYDSTLSNIEDLDNNGKKTAVPWAPMFSHLYSCPVCFGYGMCNEVMKSSVLFHGELTLSQNSRIMWKKGVLQTRRVLISSLTADEWNKFDEFICKNASHSIPCNLSVASWKTVLALENLLDLEKFKNLNTLLDIPVSQFALPVCSTEKLLLEILKSFDENFDGQFSKEERILLLTSLIMQPGYVILMLQAKTRMTMPFPNLLGACGRSVILEGGLKPLKSFLLDSFDARAGLAVQVLQLVEDFENMHEFSSLLPEEDPQWYFLYLGFSLDGIVVTKEGEVVVIDLDNLVILDKATFPPDLQKSGVKSELCNEVCFQRITLELFYTSKNTSACTHVSEYSQLMYAIVCKQVLSDIGEHRTEGFFNFDGHRIHKKQENLGLLHKIPYKIKDHIEDLLRECVQETKPNGRKAAVTELREILDNYVNINDSEGHSSKENTFFLSYRNKLK